MNRVPVQPALLRWARARAGYDADALTGRFPKLEEWERGEVQPTLKQVEAFAKATRTPVGFLFLAEPPIERVPIPDFRTVANVHVDHPSPDLLETVYLCQQRQDWYRDFAVSMREPTLDFVGFASLEDDIVEIAAAMRHILRFDLEERRRLATWTDALRHFIGQADALGVPGDGQWCPRQQQPPPPRSTGVPGLRAGRFKGSGGDFCLTLGARVSKRFARSMVVSTLEGRTAFTETFRMLGLKKMATFNELVRSLGVGY